MDNQNWPNGVNFAHQNWNRRFSRRATGMDTYHSIEDRITPMQYIGVAVSLALIFGFVPFLGWIMGAV